MSDPIVEEVRQYRLEHARKLNFDLVAICADLRAIQQSSGHKVVRLPSKNPKTGDQVEDERLERKTAHVT
jgi:hypothetical protein